MAAKLSDPINSENSTPIDLTPYNGNSEETNEKFQLETRPHQEHHNSTVKDVAYVDIALITSQFDHQLLIQKHL